MARLIRRPGVLGYDRVTRQSSADCSPLSEGWIHAPVFRFSPIAGRSPYVRPPGAKDAQSHTVDRKARNPRSAQHQQQCDFTRHLAINQAASPRNLRRRAGLDGLPKQRTKQRLHQFGQQRLDQLARHARDGLQQRLDILRRNVYFHRGDNYTHWWNYNFIGWNNNFNRGNNDSFWWDDDFHGRRHHADRGHE